MYWKHGNTHGNPWNPGRYGAWATKDWVATKVRETYGMNNHVHFPNENLLAGRQGVNIVRFAKRRIGLLKVFFVVDMFFFHLLSRSPEALYKDREGQHF